LNKDIVHLLYPLPNPLPLAGEGTNVRGN